jgi:hypothetical protein
VERQKVNLQQLIDTAQAMVPGNMALPASTCPKQEAVAGATVNCLLRAVPAAETNASAAQQALYHRARCNRAARRGEYSAAMERTQT